MPLSAAQLEAAGAFGGVGAELASGALTGGATSLLPAAVGGTAALAVGLLATPITGALIATYAPRQPVKGALLAVGLSFGLSMLAAGVAAAGVAGTIASNEEAL